MASLTSPHLRPSSWPASAVLLPLPRLRWYLIYAHRSSLTSSRLTPCVVTLVSCSRLKLLRPDATASVFLKRAVRRNRESS